jgi:RNA polymerase sigma factor (sigma-70 family)
MGFLGPQSGKWEYLRLLFFSLASTNLFKVCIALSQKPFTEEDAYIALIKGNEKGLDFFFNRYYSPLIFYSTSITRNNEVANEIAAEAFVKLWAKRETIEEWRKIRFLLYKIVHDLSVDFIREKEKTRKQATTLRVVRETAERSYIDVLIEVETHNQLYLLLQNLSPRSRQIFRMFYFQKKAIKEIATELNISVNTVKTQKLRAIQTLKKYQGSLYFIALYSLIFI